MSDLLDYDDYESGYGWFDTTGANYYQFVDLGSPFAVFDDHDVEPCLICKDGVSAQGGDCCTRCQPFKSEYEVHLVEKEKGASPEDLDEVDFDDLARASFPTEYQQAWLEQLTEVPRSTTALNAVIRCRFGIGV